MDYVTLQDLFQYSLVIIEIIAIVITIAYKKK